MHIVEWKRYSPGGDYVETVKEEIPAAEIVTLWRLIKDLRSMDIKYYHVFIE